jgi:DNA-binding transcriptional MerR regulator
MKMQALEARAGVGRETIRYYIRLGLLPEPERPKPNVAVYGDEHVWRIELIKRLQQERYLPLGFIKTLLDRRAGGETRGMPGLESTLALRMGLAPEARTPLEEAPGLTGLTAHDLEVMIRDGVVKVAPGGGLDALNLAICRTWGRAKAAGYSEENGWYAEDLKIYPEAVGAVARREMDRFFTRMSGALSVEEAAALGQAGIEIINELLALLRTRALLELAADLDAPPRGLGDQAPG